MSKTLTISPQPLGAMVALEQQKLALEAEAKSKLESWQKALSKNASRGDRKMITGQTVSTALAGMPIMSYLRRSSSEQMVEVVEVILVCQAVRLAGMLNLNRNLTDDQVNEVVDYILEQFDDLSLEAVQHCFNCIVTGAEPFAEDNLYEGMDVKKLLSMMKRYRDYLIIQREKQHKDTVMDADGAINGLLAKAPEETKKILLDMSFTIKRDKAKEQREAEVAEHQRLVLAWTADYMKLENPASSLDEYLQFQFDSHKAARLQMFAEAKENAAAQPKKKGKKKA